MGNHRSLHRKFPMIFPKTPMNLTSMSLWVSRKRSYFEVSWTQRIKRVPHVLPTLRFTDLDFVFYPQNPSISALSQLSTGPALGRQRYKEAARCHRRRPGHVDKGVPSKASQQTVPEVSMRTHSLNNSKAGRLI